MTQLEKIQILTGESDTALLSLLLENASEYILSYTNRTEMSDKLNSIQLDIAIASYNKIGSEGQQSHSEGGISVSFEDLPNRTAKVLNGFRLAKIGGKTYEAIEENS